MFVFSGRIEVAADIPTGAYRLIFEQGATVIPLVDWGTFKTRTTAVNALCDLVRWYRANGATPTHDRPIDSADKSLTMVTMTRQSRTFTLKIVAVYR